MEANNTRGASPWDKLPKANTSDLPFFGWKDVPADAKLKVELLEDVRFAPAFGGQQPLRSTHALLEFAGKLKPQNGPATDYLFAVSSGRLVDALAAVRPVKGDTVVLRAIGGAGLQRSWEASKA